MTTSLETRIQVLITERDEYQKAALNTAKHYKAESDKLTADRDAMAAAQKIERDALITALESMEDALTWVEVAHRPPVRDTLEIGRMVMIRLHALVALKEVAAQLRKAGVS